MAKGFLVNSPHAANTQDRLSQSRVYEPPKTHPLQGRQNKCETSKTKQIGNVCGVIIAAPFAFLELSQTCCVTLFFHLTFIKAERSSNLRFIFADTRLQKKISSREVEGSKERGRGAKKHRQMKVIK